jgi:hypothetical protein
MTDVFEIAVSQRDELKGEIAKLDKFINTARKLMEHAGAGQGEGTSAETAQEDSDEESKPWSQQQGDEAGSSRTSIFRR